MALRYSGPAVFRTQAGIFTVHAHLSTTAWQGVYGWAGKLTCTDIATLRADKQDATLTLPDLPDAAVHVTVADLDTDHGGVLLRVNGHGRAPYERPGDVTATPGPNGFPVFHPAEEVP